MSNASHHAKLLLRELNISSLPIDPYAIAKTIGIEVCEDDCEGYTGMILVVDDEALISVKSSLRENSRKRFTVAHELGHYRIPGHLSNRDVIFRCAECDFDVFDKKGDKESEANEFAAELLMPESFFAPKIRLKDLSYELLESLVSDFDTSLTATGIRFVALSGDCALVCSERASIKWFVKGKDFPFFLRADGKISNDSIAVQFYEGDALPDSFSPVPQYAWLDNYRRNKNVEVRELSIPIPYYNQVLSFIYADSEDEYYEDEYVQELDGYLKFKK